MLQNPHEEMHYPTTSGMVAIVGSGSLWPSRVKGTASLEATGVREHLSQPAQRGYLDCASKIRGVRLRSSMKGFKA